MELLNRITELSHEFGGVHYVRGGGGNTSVKNATTLWVKPSGTPLAALCPSDFVALDRASLSDLYSLTPPAGVSSREAMVKATMAKSVLPGSSGRASVEAPLHDSLSARYVVHTHPALVNGMTCGHAGKAGCEELFEGALWVDYIDPGYTLCMAVRREIGRYKESYGREPALIFLKNHGVFIAGDEPDEIRQVYGFVLGTLRAHYAARGVSCDLAVGPQPDERAVAAASAAIRQAFGEANLSVACSGSFVLPTGAVSPDHIVYAKSFYMAEAPTAAGIEQFRKQHHYPPHILAFDGMVFGVGPTQSKAELALELAADGALVVQLAEAFGGIAYMTDAARVFIENWEVESYRSSQVR